jgi:hypothetical protein
MKCRIAKRGLSNIKYLFLNKINISIIYIDKFMYPVKMSSSIALRILQVQFNTKTYMTIKN